MYSPLRSALSIIFLFGGSRVNNKTLLPRLANNARGKCFYLFPRLWRGFSVNADRNFRLLAGELIPSEAFSDDLAHGIFEAGVIGDWFALCIFAVIVAINLLIDVAEQVSAAVGTGTRTMARGAAEASASAPS